MNHGLGTCQWSCRSFEEEEEDDDDEIAVFPISIADSDGPLERRWDTLWIKDDSRNTVSYP